MKLANDALRGSYTPLVTPFRAGRIDLDVFARLVERQVSGGSHGIVVCGTTAESTSLSLQERAELFDTAVKTVAGRRPVVAGAGAGALEETTSLVAAAERAGVDALLVVTPYYIKPNQAGLVEYYAAVAARTSLPLLIYHIPGRAGVTVAAETVLRIRDRAEHLAGMKHAATDLDLVSELLLRLPEFRVFCGLESLSLPMLAIGAAGLMNAVGNLVPGRVARLCEAVFGGRLEEARRSHYELFELNRAVFLDTNPIPLKHMMARLGILPSAEVRLPLTGLDEAKQGQLDALLSRAGLLEGIRSAGVG